MIVQTFRILLDLSKPSEIKKIRSLLRYMVGIWSKFDQGRKFVKKVKIWKTLRMGLPIVENMSWLSGNILALHPFSGQASYGFPVAVAMAVALAVALALALALVRELLSKNLKIFKISKVLRMGLPIVENLSGPCAIIFSLFKIPQLHFN